MDTVLGLSLALKTHGLVEPSSELYDLQSALIVELSGGHEMKEDDHHKIADAP